MSKRSVRKPETRTREAPPRMSTSKEGVTLLCPFCNPSHPIVPGTPSLCGTSLRVTAVQTVISARMARMEKIVCLKCKKSSGGDMVAYMNGYIHLHDCAPGTHLITTPPKYSRFAKVVFGLHPRLRDKIEKRTGKAQRVDEIDPNGNETGRVIGYFFQKVQKAQPNG